jgi:hypothetical protein
MKKIVLLSLIIFLSITAYCQFAITSSNLPSVGSSYSVDYLDTTGANHGPAGSSQSWDFSSYAVSSSATISYTTPSGQPGASYFPNATLVTQSGISYVYYLANSSENTTLGVYETASGTTVIQSYSNPEVNFTFPFNYNTTQHDVFVGTTNETQLGTTITSYRTGNDTSSSDGYGTVKGPNGINYSVVRVKTVQNFHDSTDYGYGDYGIQNTRYETYNYFQQNTGYPIISLSYYFTNMYDTFGSSSSAINKSLTFYSSGVSGLNTNSISKETKIYPNPATDKLTIELPANKVYQLTLSDMTGKAILSSDKGDISITGNIAVANVSSLSKGIYLLEIISNGEKGVKKIVVE